MRTAKLLTAPHMVQVRLQLKRKQLPGAYVPINRTQFRYQAQSGLEFRCLPAEANKCETMLHRSKGLAGFYSVFLLSKEND